MTTKKDKLRLDTHGNSGIRSKQQAIHGRSDPLFTLTDFAEYKEITLGKLRGALKKTGTSFELKCKTGPKKYYQKSDLIAWYNKECK